MRINTYCSPESQPHRFLTPTAQLYNHIRHLAKTIFSSPINLLTLILTPTLTFILLSSILRFMRLSLS
jgi:hypothetical protein